MKKVYLLLIFLGIYGASLAQLSPYCNTEVFHLGDTTQTASSIFLTIEQDTGNTMKITMESANADPIDDIIIPGFATGFDTISPGKYSKTLSFTSPPANVSLQVLWSKVSSPGNWQLSPTNISIPFTANCAGTPPPSAQASKYCNTQVFHFGNPAEVASAINLSVGNLNSNSMKVVISSSNSDPVDDLVVAGGSGATISAIDNSIPGEMSRTLTWTTPPVEVVFNVIWSKVSSPGNWQLISGSASDTVPFIDTCGSLVTAPPTPSKTQISLPITWNDTANVDYTVTDFDGTASVLAADPANASNLVLKTTRNIAGQIWQGTTLSTPSGLASAIPFTATDQTIKAVVYSPAAGITINLKVENSANGGINSEVTTVTSVANAWDTLTFDFSTATSAIVTSNTYDKVSIFYDFLNTPSSAQDYYLDDIFFASGITPPPPASYSQYCNAQVFHFGNPAEVASEANLTITNIDTSSVKFTISSANADPVDDLILNTFSGGTPSALDTSVAGELSRTLTWATNAPDTVKFNVLWSKVSTPGNWQLITGSGFDRILFSDTCGAAPPPPPPAKAQINLPISWDDTANVNYTVTDFGGTNSMLAADPINANNTVLKTDRDANGQTWQGTTLSTPAGLASPIAFGQGSNTIRAHVYSPAVGVTIKLKVEDTATPVNFLEVDVVTTTSNAWEVIDFDFNNPTVASAGATAADPNISYTIASIFYDFGNANASTYYLDSIQLINGGGTPPPPAKAQINLPISWDDTANVNYTVTDFGGTNSMLAADPINANNTVLKTDRDPNGQTWQGTTLSTPAGLASPIAFGQGSNTIRAHVYSPAVGVTIKLKVEDTATPVNFLEVDVVTTTSNAWEVIDFDFNNPTVASAGATAADPNISYTIASIFYDFGNANASTYYLDSIQLFSGGGTPPPSKSPSDLPITWNDTANVDYSVTDFDGTSSMLMSDPMNSSNIVLRTTRNTTGQPWQGTTISNPTGLASPIPFTQGSNTISAIVYSPNVGTTIRLKVEELGNGANVYSEVDVVTTVANAWDTLIFDFNNPTSGLPVSTNNTYNVISIFYDFLGTPTSAQDYYLDDVFFGGFIAPPPPPLKAKIDLPVNWDDSANVDYSVTDYNGNASALVTDPTNSGNTVLSTTKTSASQPWAGTTLGTSSGFATPIPFSAGNTTISARIWSPDAGIQVRLKAENQFVGSISVETEATTTVAGDWDTLYFDFNNNVFQTPALDTNQNYELLTVFYDFNVAPATPAKTYYIDDVFMGGPSIAPPLVKNVTFKIDLSNYSGPAYTNVNLNGSFNNWCGGCANMTDANNDSIYEITIPLADDSVEYKFTLDGWTVDEQLTAGSICTKTTSGFTNRFLKLNGDTVLPEVCWQSCGVCTSTPVGPSTKNITFQVDMNDYTGTFTTVHVNGTFNNWCGACNPMTDANNDGVWEVTLPLAIDSIEYKFTVDGWTDDEKFAGGEPCTKTVGGFTNRFLIATGDVTLPVVCWASCSACTGAPSGTNITFKVDMNDYTSPFDTAYVNGTFNNWCGKCNPMTDANNDGVWELTINLPQDSIEFKYTVDGWNDDEKFIGGEPCTKSVGGFTNRILRLNGDTVLPELCWGSCAACTGTPIVAQVRFAVDLSQYPDTFNTAYVNGEFNGWCGKCNPLSDADGDSIWEVTITLPIGDTVQFKYTLNGWQTEEILDPNYPCVINVFNFTNRILPITGDTNLGDVCWESCWECEPVGITEGNQPNYFVVAPNPSNGNFFLDFSIPKADNIEVQLLNITGQTMNAWRYNSNQVYQQINIDGSSNGIYFLKVQTPDYVGMKKIIISK